MQIFIIAVTLGIPVAIFAEAGLSFLGLGVNDPTPSWGKMVGSSLSYIRVYLHMSLFPTLAIALTMLDNRLDNIVSMVTAVAERVMSQLVTLSLSCPHCGKNIEIAVVGNQRPTR